MKGATGKVVHTQGGTPKRRSVATAGVMLLKGPQARRPFNNMTPAVATDRLLCVPPCVCTAFCVYRLACGPFHNMTPAVARDRLLCFPPCVTESC